MKSVQWITKGLAVVCVVVLLSVREKCWKNVILFVCVFFSILPFVFPVLHCSFISSHCLGCQQMHETQKWIQNRVNAQTLTCRPKKCIIVHDAIVGQFKWAHFAFNAMSIRHRHPWHWQYDNDICMQLCVCFVFLCKSNEK